MIAALAAINSFVFILPGPFGLLPGLGLETIFPEKLKAIIPVRS
jgi:hypothetical protein